MSATKIRCMISREFIFKEGKAMNKVPTEILKVIEKIKIIDNIIMNSDYQDATAHPLWSEYEDYIYALVEQGWGYLIEAV